MNRITPALAPLLAAATAALVGCSTDPAEGPSPSASGSKGVHGLIAARSENPKDAAAFVILRPGADGWTQERVQGPEAPAELWVGEHKEKGHAVWRAVDPKDGPLDTPLKLVPGEKAWTLEPWEGIALDDVEWPTRTDRSTGEATPRLKPYQLAGGNVFHKAMWFEPRYGEPGVLTISGNVPMLKIWRKQGDTWTNEVLWTDFVGDDEQRFRDVEVGDVDGDGQDELVVVTHNRGGVYVLEQTEGGLVASRVAFTEDPIFVHEVEIGQADDDAALEFFTTPSEPNMFDGTDQAGRIDRFDFVDGEYRQSVVEDDPKSHAKEILACDVTGDGKVEIFAALEAKELKPDMTSEYPGYLNMYAFDAEGEVTRTVVGDLVGAMCRFLDFGDTDGDGTKEVVAATSRDGVFVFQRAADGSWDRRKVAGGFRSSGFEHAMVLADLDGDGTMEIVVGSDNEQQYQAFRYDPERSRWIPEKLCDVDASSYFTWGLMPLPVKL